MTTTNPFSLRRSRRPRRLRYLLALLATISLSAAVVALLAGVAILVVLSALTLAPLEKFGGRSVVPFLISLFAIWAGALFIIYLIRHTIV